MGEYKRRIRRNAAANLGTPVRPLIERYQTCKDADEMVAMQEAIQAEIQQEAQDRRDAQHDGDPNDMLFENPNHAASAWRPLQRSKKQLQEQNLSLTDEDPDANAADGGEEDGSGQSEADEGLSSEEKDGEYDEDHELDDEDGDEEDEDEEQGHINAGRIRKTDKLGNDYWVEPEEETRGPEDDVSTVTSAVKDLAV